MMHLRNLILVLLICCFSPTASSETPKNSVKQWEPDIRAFEFSDKTNRPPANPILFIGSSSFRIWKTVAADFPEYKVVNRGFGGSQIFEINYYFKRIVKPYHPKTIVFYAGDNDLGRGRSSEEVFHDFKTFVEKTHWALPKTKILFISIKPSLARWKNKDNIMRANQLIEAYAREKEYVDYVDVFAPMLDKEGLPQKDLFLKDGLHMNRKGYELWISILKPVFKELEQEQAASGRK
ncbi:MAG: lipolytic enzyme family [Verrucomicrobiales bacterium]|nr:lipolytic enzyme family [Verrucomicrobiales bacterium]